MTNKTVPITLRIEQKVIDNLKEEARTLSFRLNKDISYVDLIRKYIIENIESVDIKDMLKKDKDISKNEIVVDVTADDIWNQFIEGKPFGKASIKIEKFLNNYVEENSLARKVLMVNDISKGRLARYEKPIDISVFIILRRAVTDIRKNGEEILIPTWEIASNCSIPLQQLRSKRDYIVAKMLFKMAIILREEETKNLFILLSRVTKEDKKEKIHKNIFDAISDIIEESEIDKICMHTDTYKRLYNELYDSNTVKKTTKEKKINLYKMKEEYLFLHNAGMIYYNRNDKTYNAIFSVDNCCPENEIFFVSKSNETGAMPIREKSCALLVNEAKKLHVGIAISEEIGMMAFSGTVQKLKLMKNGEIVTYS